MRLAQDEALVAAARRRCGARIALSFDTFEQARGPCAAGRAPARDQAALPGPAREARRRHDAHPGDDPRRQRPRDRPHPRSSALARADIRHLEVHTDHVHRAGRRRASIARAHLDARGAAPHRGDDRAACSRRDDFVPSPCAHPLCYQIAYLLLDPDGRPAVPFTRFMPARRSTSASPTGSTWSRRPRLEEALHDAIDRLWADEAATRRQRTLRMLEACSTRCSRPGGALSRRRGAAGLASARRRPSTCTRTWTRRPSTSSASRSAATPTATPTARPSRSATTTCSTARRRRAFMTRAEAWNERSGGVSRPASHRRCRAGSLVDAAHRLAGKRCLVTGGSRGLGLAHRRTRSRARGRAGRLHLLDATRDDAEEAPGAHRRARRRGAARVPGLGRRRRARAGDGGRAGGGLGRHRRAGQQRRHQPGPARSRCSRRRTGTQVMDVNVKGAYLFSRAVLRHMIRARRGPHPEHRHRSPPSAWSRRRCTTRRRSRRCAGFTEALAREVGRYDITGEPARARPARRRAWRSCCRSTASPSTSASARSGGSAPPRRSPRSRCSWSRTRTRS